MPLGGASWCLLVPLNTSWCSLIPYLRFILVISSSNISSSQNKNSNTKQNTKSAQRSQKYQFVGVCDETGAGRTKWYARPRPSGPKSSFLVRMIRLDKKALLRDMLLSREVDVYVEYENSGKVDGSNGRFLVEPKYSVKVRE